MKTKSDLLAVMAEHKACREATEYVTDHTSDSAEEIGLSCDRGDWLIWVLVRERVNLTDFVNGCAKRAKGYAAGATHAANAAGADCADVGAAIYAADYAVGATRYAAIYAAAYVAAYVVVYAADYAAGAARYATRSDDTERKTQLEQLHGLWKEWCRS